MREAEPLPWLGDLMFWTIIKELINAREPLIEILQPDEDWPLNELQITSAGRQVLTGKRNFLDLVSSKRWLGGICITPR